MSMESEQIIFDSFGVIAKLSGEDKYMKPFCPPVYLQHTEDAAGDRHSHILVGGYLYPIELEGLVIDENRGTIAFRAFDGTYLIRLFQESDSEWFSAGIPLTSDFMERMMEIDEQFGTGLSVEGLVEEATQQLVAIVLSVENLGVFFRINQSWEMATPALSARYDGTVCFDIIYHKAKEIIAMWDAGKPIRMTDLVSYIDVSTD